MSWNGINPSECKVTNFYETPDAKRTKVSWFQFASEKMRNINGGGGDFTEIILTFAEKTASRTRQRVLKTV